MGNIRVWFGFELQNDVGVPGECRLNYGSPVRTINTNFISWSKVTIVTRNSRRIDVS